MKLVTRKKQPLLFGEGEVLNAEIVPAAGSGKAVLVVEGGKTGRHWLSPADAEDECLAIQAVTPEEHGMLIGAGYRLPIDHLKPKA
jgi:hypothetical protein